MTINIAGTSWNSLELVLESIKAVMGNTGGYFRTGNKMSAGGSPIGGTKQQESVVRSFPVVQDIHQKFI